MLQLVEGNDRLPLEALQQFVSARLDPLSVHQSAKLLDGYRLTTPGAGHQRLLGPPGLVVSNRQQERGTQLGQVVEAVLVAQVVQVITDLVSDSQGLAIASQHRHHLRPRAGPQCTQLERHFERWSGFLAIDLQHLIDAQRPGISRPDQLGPLSQTEGPMAGRGMPGKLPTVRRFGQQAVPLSHEQVTDIERHRHPLGDVHRLFAVPLVVVVLDVVMDQ